MSIWDNIKSYFVVREKLNPAQELMSYAEGHVVGSKSSVSYRQAFTRLESVSSGVGLLVGACSSLDYDIKDKIGDGNYVGIRAGNLNRLLNIRPNPYQPLQEFRYNIFTDFLLEGNAFIYYDGAFLYHIPAAAMQIIPDEKTFIASYKYNGLIDFKPSEIAHFKDMNGNSIYRGHSRLEAADRNIRILYKMQDFQETFFDNGAIPGFALTTDNTLSQVSKDKTIANWMVKYNPKNGAKKPIILDSGMKPAQLFTTSFKEMDFDISVSSANVRILETIGVPPVLLDGGNQANISPNLRLIYLETVLPIVRKYVSAMEFLSGYDIEAITTTVSALQPDIKDIAAYNVGLVNGGILTANEARTELRYAKDKDPESDKLRVPANIAGSAVQPNIGGAPKKPPPQ
jgi:HK97 family phage portal protein